VSTCRESSASVCPCPSIERGTDDRDKGAARGVRPWGESDSAVVECHTSFTACGDAREPGTEVQGEGVIHCGEGESVSSPEDMSLCPTFENATCPRLGLRSTGRTDSIDIRLMLPVSGGRLIGHVLSLDDLKAFTFDTPSDTWDGQGLTGLCPMDCHVMSAVRDKGSAPAKGSQSSAKRRKGDAH